MNSSFPDYAVKVAHMLAATGAPQIGNTVLRHLDTVKRAWVRGLPLQRALDDVIAEERELRAAKKAKPKRRRDPVSEHPDFAGRIIDTAHSDDVGGIAYRNGDGTMTTYHVTDRPDDVMRFLRRKGRVMAAYGEKGRTSELGPGFYTSGNPNVWLSRSTGKWSFLPRLSGPPLERLLHALEKEILERRGLTESERANALRDISYVRAGHYDAGVLTSLAASPYGVAFWRPEYLEKVGVQGAKEPAVLELRIRGKFAELSRSYADKSLLRNLRRMGLQGAFTRSSMATNPEMVIWDPRAIVSVTRSS